MRKKIFIISITVVILAILLNYLQWGNNDIIISSSNIETSKNAKIENITVTSNKLFIEDKEKFALDIIQACVDNILPDGIKSNVKFSNDMGYPNKIIITVYMNDYLMKQGKESFKIMYAQDKKYNYQYNVKDNPEKFQIIIE